MGFGAVQTLVGVTKLSELGIDVSKNWLTYLIKGLGDPVDAQDAATRAYILAQLAAYLPLAGGTMSGNIAMGLYKVQNMGNPTLAQDAATRDWVVAMLADYLLLAGGTMSGAIAMGANKITGLADPAAAQDAVTKAYCDKSLTPILPYIATLVTSEQLLYDTGGYLYSGRWPIGQRLTISDRLLTKIGFWLSREASPTGNVSVRIRKVSDNTLICEQVLVDASTVVLSATYYEATLDAPIAVNEEVRMYVYYPYGTGVNYIRVWYKIAGNVAPGEMLTLTQDAGDTNWVDGPFGEDCAYKYTYVTP